MERLLMNKAVEQEKGNNALRIAKELEKNQLSTGKKYVRIGKTMILK